MVADNCSIGHIMGMDEKKAERLEAYIKNQYVRTVVRVIKFKILLCRFLILLVQS